MTFFGEVLGLERAHIVPDRRVAFYWIARDHPTPALAQRNIRLPHSVFLNE
jgi:hypothetical protein